MRGPPNAAELLLVVSVLSLCSLFLYQFALPSTLQMHPPPAALVLESLGTGVAQLPRTAPASAQLHQLLRTLERQQSIEASLHRVAQVRGAASQVARDLPAISSALTTLGFELALPSNASYRLQENWSLFMCQSFSEKECQLNDIYSKLRPDQRVNRIPGLRLILGLSSSLCNIQSRLSALGFHQKSDPFCFILPEQYEDLLNAADGPGLNSSWFLKSTQPGVRPEMITTSELFARARLKQLPGSAETVVQQAVLSPLKVLGHPLSVQVFLLISSIAPLRAYVHSQGLVYFRYGEERGFKKIPGKTWLLSQLWRHLVAREGAATVRSARETLDNTLTRLLLASETPVLTSLADLPTPPSRARYRGQQSFQLVRAEFLLDTALTPTLLDIDTVPSLKELVDSPYVAAAQVPVTVLKDTFRLIFASDVVHNDVMEALHAASTQETGVVGLNCLISHELCLTQEDLKYLLTTRREALSIGDFRRLYPPTPTPSTTLVTYTPQHTQLMQALQQETETIPTVTRLLRDTLRHTTADMDNLVTNMEKFLSLQETQDDDYAYLTEPKLKYASFNLQSLQSVRNKANEVTLSSQPSSTNNAKLHDISVTSYKQHGDNDCSDDPTSGPYLRELNFEPGVFLSPSFSPLWTDYRAEVPYHVTLVRISASAMRCGVVVHFDDRELESPLRSSNYNTTIGVGENHVNVQLFDSSTSKNEVGSGPPINTYTLTIVRKEAGDGDIFESSQVHQVCSLRQECEFRFSPTESCGLQSEFDKQTWDTVISNHKYLPNCKSGDAYGRWVVPCVSCSNHDSCWWRVAQWQPYSCSHGILDEHHLRNCLQDKKILFLGDSTIRGMMHYILERLNGSLSARDKTHSLRVYPGLNSGRTALSFAYYPQFWLRAPQRPVFAKSLYRLLLKSQPLRNTSDTVVVVGGVHWLATHHLHTLLRAMRREGLQGARLVVKTLGSGFHIPADGVHSLSKRQQEKLLLHSQGLAAFARHYHMDMVDTFNMTAARYQDFMPGKCACHFHKITESTSRGDAPRYHVEGSVNAIYSEILLSRICNNINDENNLNQSPAA